jgi:hypothetical protein
MDGARPWDPHIIEHFLTSRTELPGVQEDRLGDELNLAVTRALAVPKPLVVVPPRFLNG